MNARTLFALASALAASVATAQIYTAVELSGGGTANAVSGGVSVGQTGQYEFGRATLWDANGVRTDVHPAFLATPSGVGFSNIYGVSGSLAVGLGQRNDRPNQAVAVRWNGTAPTPLADPFTIYSSVALGTDGVLIAGWAAPLQTVRGQPSPGTMRAMLWDASGRVVADLSGGKVNVAYAVAKGQQVGYEVKGGNEARLWRGTASSVVSLHPKNFGMSAAYATDGVHQVGTAGNSVKVVNEARRGVELLMNSATVWSGTAASMVSLPFTLPEFSFTTAVATGVSGDRVCGYGTGLSRTGAPQTSHAVVWSLSRGAALDLHGLLPAGYASSQATGVDAQGNVSGFAVDAAGVPHAFAWRLSGV